jgi:hypothetical protein
VSNGKDFVSNLVQETLGGGDPSKSWEEANGGASGDIYGGADEGVIDSRDIEDHDPNQDYVNNTEANEEPKVINKDPKQAADKSSQDFVSVTGSDGKKQRINIDWEQKDKIKQQISMAYGARKWQAERDQANGKLKEAEPVLNLWKELESAWQKGSTPAERYLNLVDFIEGKEGAGKGWLDSELAKRAQRANASPEELKAMEAQESRQREQSEYAKLKAEMEKLTKSQAEHKDEVRTRETNALVQPIFSQFSFEGKLGNAADEIRLNKLLWSETTERLQAEYPEGHTFTKAELAKEFGRTHKELKRLGQERAEKQVAKVIENKKTEAQTNVQNFAKANYSKPSGGSELNEAIRKGDFSAVFKAFGKK